MPRLAAPFHYIFGRNTFSAALGAAAACLFAVGATAQAGSGGGYARTYSEVWDYAQSLPGAETSYAAGQTVVHIPSQGAVYIFTKWSHPAHPAVMRTELMNDAGAAALAVDLLANGDVAAAQAWRDAWEELLREDVFNEAGSTGQAISEDAAATTASGGLYSGNR